jgi:hypothetical protein
VGSDTLLIPYESESGGSMSRLFVFVATALLTLSVFAQAPQPPPKTTPSHPRDSVLQRRWLAMDGYTVEPFLDGTGQMVRAGPRVYDPRAQAERDAIEKARIAERYPQFKFNFPPREIAKPDPE